MEGNNKINARIFTDMFISASNAIEAEKLKVNELNVFPVPDGDTGTNMSMTMNAAKQALTKLEARTVGEAAETAATSLLRGARGNSGVILSLLFRGVSKCLSGKVEATGEDIAASLKTGVDSAYRAVMKPAEGTILTVAREAAEACSTLPSPEKSSCISVLETVCNRAAESLAKTPELLPVLKKAGVVDAGGKGLVIIFNAMLFTLKGNGIMETDTENNAGTGETAADSDEEIKFTYCTEFIINKEPGQSKDPLALRACLEALGDSVLVADENSFIKVHVHSNNPDRVIAEALKYGYLTDIKIDNMRVQHQNRVSQKKQIDKPLGFVAVSTGDGIKKLFEDLGADKVVEGGQTMNPSTDDILGAIEDTTAETVVVLPNNKNIILAAEQAVALSDRKVHVLHTKTIPQGISAMLGYDPDAELNDNLIAMNEAAGKVRTGLVTFAARDSDFDGHKISKDEILALSEGKLSFTDSDSVKAAVKLAKNLSDKNTSYVTLIYGENIAAEDAENARAQVAEKLGSQAEVTLINGGQPVYYFIISVE